MTKCQDLCLPNTPGEVQRNLRCSWVRWCHQKSSRWQLIHRPACDQRWQWSGASSHQAKPASQARCQAMSILRGQWISSLPYFTSWLWFDMCIILYRERERGWESCSNLSNQNILKFEIHVQVRVTSDLLYDVMCGQGVKKTCRW